MKIFTTAQMKAAERLSNEMGVTYQRLMENAGCAAAAFIRRSVGSVVGRNFMVFCGGGNNGGDGFVVARKLFEEGANVITVLCGGAPRTDEAKYMYNCILAADITVLDFAEDRTKIDELIGGADYIVDGLFGTGFSGEFGEPFGEIAALINEAKAVKIALDIPSGVNAESGEAAKGAVRADYTVAFDALKPGHILLPGREFCGKAAEVDIGIPHEVLEQLPQSCFKTTEEMVFSSIRPRPAYSNKGTYGRLLCVTGSEKYPGAAAISALGALRMGAGITAVATEKGVVAAIAGRIPEATFHPLPEGESEGALDESKELILPVLKKASSVLIGCGLGQGERARELTQFVLTEAECTAVLDADALNCIAETPEMLLLAKKTPIITPHVGEMARFCGLSIADVLKNRVELAVATAKKFHAVVVLKDATTVVAAPNGDVYFNPTGNPGLSKGGSGDCLAGMIAALAAQGCIETASAVCGVYLHGAAADLAAAELSQYGMLPTDIPFYLAKLLAEKGL